MNTGESAAMWNCLEFCGNSAVPRVMMVTVEQHHVIEDDKNVIFDSIDSIEETALILQYFIHRDIYHRDVQ